MEPPHPLRCILLRHDGGGDRLAAAEGRARVEKFQAAVKKGEKGAASPPDPKGDAPKDANRGNRRSKHDQVDTKPGTTDNAPGKESAQ